MHSTHILKKVQPIQGRAFLFKVVSKMRLRNCSLPSKYALVLDYLFYSLTGFASFFACTQEGSIHNPFASSPQNLGMCTSLNFFISMSRNEP
jgi:hypothetical protein